MVIIKAWTIIIFIIQGSLVNFVLCEGFPHYICFMSEQKEFLGGWVVVVTHKILETSQSPNFPFPFLGLTLWIWGLDF